MALIVFFNGMAIMVLEMAGARMLAPWLGTSVVVWTSLIGVILASLSLGYCIGGRLADKCLRAGEENRDGNNVSAAAGGNQRARARGVLAFILVMASVTVFVAALLGQFFLDLFSRTLPLHAAAVCAALALFAAPGVLCGMVSPYATRLAIVDSETAGTVIGRLNAVATVGSIAGTFLGGFVLLSWFATTTIFFGVAFCLLAAAALARTKPLLPKTVIGLFLLGSIVAEVIHSNRIASAVPEEGVIPIETAYSSLRVAAGPFHGKPARFLITDPGSAQSAAFVDAPDELAFSYTSFYALGTGLNPGAKRILMLGGGGYSVPKWLLSGRSDLRAEDFLLDVVELDPGMTRAAQEYFWTPREDPRMRVFHEDARIFLNREAAAVPPDASGPYDLIFADTFNSWYAVPFHLGTLEAARRIRSLLAEDGVYVMNVITAVNGDNGRLLRAIRGAFAEVFGEAHIFPVQDRHDGERVQNVMLVAFRKNGLFPDPAGKEVAPHIARLLEHRWVSPFTDAEGDVPPLRDDFAPVERYTLGYSR